MRRFLLLVLSLSVGALCLAQIQVASLSSPWASDGVREGEERVIHKKMWIALTKHNRSKETTLLRAKERLASKIIRGQNPAASAVAKPLLFRPGTLQVSSVEALRHCHADVNVYEKHFRWVNRVSMSQKYGIIYAMLPKSGSSTARLMMREKFDGVEKRFKANQYNDTQLHNLTVFTFVRDPLSRFFASYDESFARTGPWQKGYRPKDGYRHPFPYLHDAFDSYQDYEDVFCPPETRTSRKECTQRQSQENGTLSARLSRFVWEWDGLDPFDDHLHLQVPLLMDRSTGRSIRVDEIYNTTAAKAGWEHLGRAHGIDLSSGVLHAKTHPRRFDVKFVSDKTKKRICELALLDYCCLNLPLPAECSGLFCKLTVTNATTPDGENQQSQSIQIEPLSHPQSSRK